MPGAVSAITPGRRRPREGSLEEGIEFLKSFDIVVHPRCQHTIDELTLYRYSTDPLTGQLLPKLQDKDNHVIDALRYACEGARRAMMAHLGFVHTTIKQFDDDLARQARITRLPDDPTENPEKDA